MHTQITPCATHNDVRMRSKLRPFLERDVISPSEAQLVSGHWKLEGHVPAAVAVKGLAGLWCCFDRLLGFHFVAPVRVVASDP